MGKKDWLIDCLLFDIQQAVLQLYSGQKYIEMREGIGQPSQ